MQFHVPRAPQSISQPSSPMTTLGAPLTHIHFKESLILLVYSWVIGPFKICLVKVEIVEIVEVEGEILMNSTRGSRLCVFWSFDLCLFSTRNYNHCQLHLHLHSYLLYMSSKAHANHFHMEWRPK